MDFKEEELDYELGKEFLEQVFIHKSGVVMGALLTYYKGLAETGVNIPEFMDDTPLEKAQQHYFKLLGNKNAFNEMYEKCWDKYGAILP